MSSPAAPDLTERVEGSLGGAGGGAGRHVGRRKGEREWREGEGEVRGLGFGFIYILFSVIRFMCVFIGLGLLTKAGLYVRLKNKGINRGGAF